MLATTIKQPPPATVWLRRNKSLYCLMLPPPQTASWSQAQGAALALPDKQPATPLFPLSLAITQLSTLSHLSPICLRCPLCTPLSPLFPRRLSLQGGGPAARDRGPQGRGGCLVRRRRWKPCSFSSELELGGRSATQPLLLSNPPPPPPPRRGRSVRIHCAPASPAIAAPTGRRGSDPFLPGGIPARAGAVRGWTAACVSIPFCWS